jgi:serine/threonine protein kinase/tetratricopeptide (TPR) repeat protein
MDCLDEDRVLAYVQRLMPATEAKQLQHHIESCESCFDVIAEMSRANAAKDEGERLVSTVYATRRSRDARGPARHGLDLRRRVGRYELIEELGSGGMGVVYRAYDPALDRQVALKLIRSDLPIDKGDLSVRLLREAHLMARLKHPNVVTIHDLGVDGDQMFLAMELIEGTTLRQWLAEGEHSWREILQRFLEAARGLAAAHESGLVHRDFKPDNVLVTGSRVLVTDFGLACTLAALPEDRTMVRAGTPHYMAPEQFRGDPSDVRTDVFSFSAALYEALYRQPAFAGDTYEERRLAVLAGRFRPAPERSAVPRWLYATLIRGLSTRADMRPDSMAALIDLLQQDQRTEHRRRRIGLGALMLVIGLSAWWVSEYRSPLSRCQRTGDELADFWSSEQKDRLHGAIEHASLAYGADTWRTVEGAFDRFLDHWRSSYARACEATHRDGTQSGTALDARLACLGERRQAFVQLRDLLATGESAVADHAAIAASQLESLTGCEDAQSLSAPVPIPPDVAELVHAAGLKIGEASAFQLAGKPEEAMGTAEAAVVAAERSAHAPTLANALFRRASIRVDRGLLVEAEGDLEAAIDAAERGRADRTRASAATQLVSLVGQRLRRIAEGRRWAGHAEAILERIHAGPRETASLAMNRGLLLMAAGEMEEAERELRRALALRERIEPRDDYLIATTLGNLAVMVQNQGRYAAARELHQRAYQRLSSVLGASHPKTLVLLGNIAGTSYALGNPRQAASEYEAVLALQRTTQGEQHPHTINTRANLANIYLELGDAPRALAYIEPAVAAARDGSEPNLTAFVEMCSAAAYAALGQSERALTAANDALELSQNGPSSPVQIAEAELRLARVYLDGDRPTEALPHATRSLQLLRSAQRVDHNRIADVLDVIGDIERELGHARAAVERHQTARRLRQSNSHLMWTTYAYLGRAELEAGDRAHAREHLEQALAVAGVTEPQLRAATAFALARVTPEFDRARALLREAVNITGPPGTRAHRVHAEISRWLQAHPKTNRLID